MTRDLDKYQKFVDDYWMYYLELEQMMVSTKRYVEFDKSNFSTYSMQYQQLLENACGELDVVGQYIAHELDDGFNRDNKRNTIQHWWYVIQSWYANISNYQTATCNDTINLTPWNSFHVEKTSGGPRKYKLQEGAQFPVWWNAYNSVKHNRTLYDKEKMDKNYRKANLENTLNAFAALYLLERSYLESVKPQDIETKFDSRLFEFSSTQSHATWRDVQSKTTLYL